MADEQAGPAPPPAEQRVVTAREDGVLRRAMLKSAKVVAATPSTTNKEINLMIEEYFEITYRYYQYNSGAADNGEYTRTIKKTDRAEAEALTQRINDSARHHRLNEFDQCDAVLAEELIPYMGYFLGAQLFKCHRELIAKEPK